MPKNCYIQYADSDMLLKNNPVLYEIYPRSFIDSDNDGYGDLKGIISKLDYLKELGVTILWITPFFPSPMKDCGYDIADFCNVSPEAGTMEDFRELVKEIHARDMQIVLDMVLNHTSDRHPWFVESRSSRTNPKRDWYIWRDPVNGDVPNNWKSVFDPSAWELDKHTGQYYLHSFLKEQPDLNWNNPEVREAVKSILAFWMDEKVDGFRLDAINYLVKHQDFPDEPVNPNYNAEKQSPFYQLQHIYMKDQPGLFPYVKEMAEYVYSYGEAFLITEAYPRVGENSIPHYMKFYSISVHKNIIPFNFEFITLDWEAQKYRQFIADFLQAIGEDNIPQFVMGNHDRPRLASRIGVQQARTAAVLLLSLPGIPVIYYGEELGMQNVRPIPQNKIHDTKEYRSPGFGRDPFRTPMQWDETKFAGFSETEPWLPLENACRERNVAVEEKDAQSLYSLYKRLLTLRHDTNNVLSKGEYRDYEAHNDTIYAFTRYYNGIEYLIALNFFGEDRTCVLPEGDFRLLLSSATLDTEGVIQSAYFLKPYEGVILQRG